MVGVRGRSGRHRKPTIQLMREGTYTESRHGGRVDVVYPAGDPKPLRGLGVDGRWLWQVVVTETPRGILADVDAAQLFALCRWWSHWRRLDRKLTVDRSSADIRAAGFVWSQFTALASQFGLSPTARAGLKANPQAPPVMDPLAAMIAMRSHNPPPGA